MKRDSSRSRARGWGFTLVELLVVIAIIGILVALLLPAVQAAREAARRSTCVNNVKNLALGCLNYESTHKNLPRGRKFDYWDTYTWTEYVLPFIEQQAVYDLYWTLPDNKFAAPANWPGPNSPIGNDARLRQARHSSIPLFYCPSDRTPIPNELNTLEFGTLRGNYRACTGAGDMYGTRIPSTVYNPLPRSAGDLLGALGIWQEKDPATGKRPDELLPGTKLSQLSDGSSTTLLISEGIAATVQEAWGGVMGSHIYGNMGGSLFSAVHPPNSSVADRPIGPCPQDQGDTEYVPPCLSWGQHPGTEGAGGEGAFAVARSYHPGGVNAAMVDGAVSYVSDDIDTAVWRARGTAAFADTAQ